MQLAGVYKSRICWATGVTGIDMYAKNSDGKWLWCSGKYSFGDTITYRFTGLLTKDQYGNEFEYYLYLPLYNSVVQSFSFLT